MPNTLIREGYLDSDRISRLCDFDDLVFFRLLLAADDAGRTDGRMDKLRSALFPTRERVRSTDIEKAVGHLIIAELIVRWDSQGKPVIQILRWHRRSGAKFSRFPDESGEFKIDWVSVQTRDGEQFFSSTSLLRRVSEPIGNPYEGVSEKPTYTDTKTETKSDTKTEQGAGDEIPIELSADEFKSAWKDWNTHRREIRKPMTHTSTRKQLKQLAGMGLQRAIEAIEHSIANGWQGIFEPNGRKNGSTKSKPIAAETIDIPDYAAPEEAEMVLQAAARTAAENLQRKDRASNPMTVEIPRENANSVDREQEMERLKRDRAVMQLLDSAQIPPKFTGVEFGDTGHVPVDAVMSYAAACARLISIIDTPGIVAMIGGRGPGKTTIACGLIRECCRRVKSARFIDAMDYFIAVRETYGINAKANQSQVEAAHIRPFLLVIDELQERGDTPWEDRMLTRLINKRYAAKVATVLISNQDKKSFAERVGESIADRIRDGGGIIVCDWKSLRGRTT